MKVHQIVCPKCESSLTSKAGIEEGTSINCPKCKNKFAVASPSKEDEVYEDFDVVDDDEEETPKKAGAKPAASRSEAEDEDDEEAPSKPAAKSSLKPLSKQRKVEAEDEDDEEAPRKPAAKSSLKPLSKKRGDDDEEADRPKKASSVFGNRDDDDKPAGKNKKRRDDEDESPKSRRKSRDEDDEDDEDEKPRRRKRRGGDDEDEPKSAYGKLKSNIYVRAGVLGVLLVILGISAYMLYEKNKNKKDDSTPAASNTDDDLGKPLIVDTRKPKGKTPNNPNPGKVTEQSELALFQGSWRPLSMSDGGAAAPPEELAKVTFTIRNNEMTMSVAPNEINRLRLDPSKSPAEIDTTDSMKTEKGIYRFVDPNTLEICISSNETRPKAFVSNKENPHLLMRLQRIK